MLYFNHPGVIVPMFYRSRQPIVMYQYLFRLLYQLQELKLQLIPIFSLMILIIFHLVRDTIPAIIPSEGSLSLFAFQKVGQDS